MRLNASAAYMATAWGLFQLLGHRYRGAGFESVEDLVASMYVSEGRQIAAFVALAKSRSLLAAAIRERDWPAIARLYNGPAWQAHRYDERLAAAFRDLGGDEVAAPAAAAESAPAPEGADTAVPAVTDGNRAVGEHMQTDSEVATPAAPAEAGGRAPWDASDGSAETTGAPAHHPPELSQAEPEVETSEEEHNPVAADGDGTAQVSAELTEASGTDAAAAEAPPRTEQSEISAAEGSTADQPVAGATQPALPDADALLACLHGVQWPADPAAAFALLGAANSACAQPPEALAAAAATSPRSLRFRPDVFSRLTGGAFDASHPRVSRPSLCEPPQGQSGSHAAGGIAFGGDGSSVTSGSGAEAAPDTAHLLAEARQLHEEAALAATEWGCYRVPGVWYRHAGHEAPIWLAQELASGFPHDCRALLRSVAADGVKAAALAAHDWQTAASLLWGDHAARCGESDSMSVEGMRAATAAERAQRLQAAYEHYRALAP